MPRVSERIHVHYTYIQCHNVSQRVSHFWALPALWRSDFSSPMPSRPSHSHSMSAVHDVYGFIRGFFSGSLRTLGALMVYFMMVYDCAAAKAGVLISLKVIWGILGQLKYLWPESERCFSPSSLSSLQITGSEVLRE